MTVSVIIPTYNGAHKIPGVIEALKVQQYKDFEVIIVIDGSTDNTKKFLDGLNHTFYKFTVLNQANRGRGAVRNAGANIAEGELLIFFDDDMLPLEDCVARHVKHHLEVPNSVLTGGLKEPVLADSSEILKYKSYLSTKWNLNLRSAGGLLRPNQIFITAANFSMRKKDFDSLKGFDEDLNDSEDFDLAIRAYKAGFALYFKEEVFAWHNDSFTCVSYIKRQRQYMAADKKLRVLKPWIYEEKYRSSPYEPRGWRKMVYQIFCDKRWVKAVDNGRLKLLPRNIRYKVYDLIITANGILYPEKVTLNN